MKYFDRFWHIFCAALYLVVFASNLLALPVLASGNALRLVGEVLILFVCFPAAMWYFYILPYDLVDVFQNGFALPDERETFSPLFPENEQGIVSDKDR